MTACPSGCEESPDSTRQRCRVTPGRSNPTESATEKKLPSHAGVRVKRWGKSPPRRWQQGWQGKPHREQCQIGTARRLASGDALSPAGSGWQLEGHGQPWLKMNGHPEGATPWTESGLQALRAYSA